ncbi:di-heme oxidoredictase family protein [Roseivivax sp. THAF30]|uniref:di-heme oxidoreductase family protein n=1 Tax=Roseivivax sp. THAF30 TaxID=2587852 RepID=UPI0012696163|nr:di-heme oxidoredictase family protein [Roseivivax sp. THAF30]QFT62646.1 Cytochrome c [Roseivivax sp. THAF30]
MQRGAITGLWAATFLAGVTTLANAETAAERKARILAPTQDFSEAEQFELYQGGSGTNTERLDANAFSLPSAALSFEQRSDFFVGNGVFDRPWVAAPSSTTGSDGLGPYFNARSCQGCHIKDGRGHPPEEGDSNLVSMLFALSDPSGAPDPVFGHQFQDQAVTGMAAEGKVSVSYEAVPFEYPDGTRVVLRHPVYKTDADLAPGVALKPRIAPPMIGLGLIEAIQPEDIRAYVDAEDTDGDGISGRPHILEDGTLGRFGWKATAGSILEQSAIAFSNDVGLSTRLIAAAYGDCTEAQGDCRNAFHGDDDGAPEIADDLLDLVTFYSANLAVPARRDPGAPDVLAGKALFYEAGCTSCHVPKYATASGAAPEQRNQLIWPYSDFLLHDMGEGLADRTPTGDVAASEWRTPPLWGIGLTETVSGHTYFLHDGRARSLEEAILWHDGEARASRDAFAAFTADEREQILQFLGSL